jgi:hypothetical protein
MEEAGFPLFKRIPDANVIGRLQAYDSLGTEQRDMLKDAIAARAARWWGFPYDHHAPTPAARLFDSFIRVGPSVSATLIEERPRPKAPKLREFAKSAFSRVFGASAAKHPNEPGDWVYGGTALGRPIEIIVRYSTRQGQIVYGVKIDGHFTGYDFNIELLYGFGVGGWNLIDDDNIEDAFATLCDAIEEAVLDFTAVQQIAGRFQKTT